MTSSTITWKSRKTVIPCGVARITDKTHVCTRMAVYVVSTRKQIPSSTLNRWNEKAKKERRKSFDCMREREAETGNRMWKKREQGKEVNAPNKVELRGNVRETERKRLSIWSSTLVLSRIRQSKLPKKKKKLSRDRNENPRHVLSARSYPSPQYLNSPFWNLQSFHCPEIQRPHRLPNFLPGSEVKSLKRLDKNLKDSIRGSGGYHYSNQWKPSFILTKW